MLYLIAYYAPAFLCGLHVVKTGRELYWLWIFVIAGPLGAGIYFFAIILPELMGGRTARGMGRIAQQTLDPEREYRRAKQTYEDSPTVGARMKVAQAAAALGRWDEAEREWRESAQGHWADDPAILMGHAVSLIELGKYDQALARLEELRKVGKEGETPTAALAFARAYEGLGRFDDADPPYRFAADRVAGLKLARAMWPSWPRPAATEDAKIGLAELDRRLNKIAPPLRPEARNWRDLAAKAVTGAA